MFKRVMVMCVLDDIQEIEDKDDMLQKMIEQLAYLEGLDSLLETVLFVTSQGSACKGCQELSTCGFMPTHKCVRVLRCVNKGGASLSRASSLCPQVNEVLDEVEALEKRELACEKMGAHLRHLQVTDTVYGCVLAGARRGTVEKCACWSLGSERQPSVGENKTKICAPQSSPRPYPSDAGGMGILYIPTMDRSDGCASASAYNPYPKPRPHSSSTSAWNPRSNSNAESRLGRRFRPEFLPIEKVVQILCVLSAP
eukprot:5512962-Pyramimonas_sp.AAC.1